MSMSLIKMLNDPSLLFDNERMVKKIEEVKQSKDGLLGAARNYESKYQQEIDEGIRQKQLLLSDSRYQGMKEEDVLKQQGRFIPTRYTPILNLLYFMLREENMDSGFEETRVKFNKQYGHLQDEYICEENDVTEPPPELETFLYGNMSHDMFKKIKKLKALSKSSNENEAFLAYRMCLEFCKKYGLEFDKIPCNITKE